MISLSDDKDELNFMNTYSSININREEYALGMDMVFWEAKTWEE